MERIAYVARMQTGKEAEVRAAQERLTTGDLERLGVQSFESFLGSGYYLMVFGLEQEQDAQGALARIFADRAFRGFLDEVRPYVQDLPSAGEQYAAGDNKHNGGRVPSNQQGGAMVTSAQLPLAASAFTWRAAGA